MTDSAELALLRRRDSLSKRRQLWVAGLVIWAVVVGWVLFGVVNSFADEEDNIWLSWALTWLAPVVILAAGSLASVFQLRACNEEIVRHAR